MEQLAFFAVDIFIIFVVFISLLIGLIRGATKEVLSVIAWFGSIFLTISIFPYAKEIAREHIKHGLIADFVTACILFVMFLTLLSIFNYMCSNFVKKSILSSVDKFLGSVFGILRGIVIVAIIDIVSSQWLITDATPQWIEQSRLRPLIMNIANSIILVLPNSMQDSIVSHMSQINKDNLMRYLTHDVINSIAKVDENYAHSEATQKNSETSQFAPEKTTDEKDDVYDENTVQELDVFENNSFEGANEKNKENLQKEEAKNLATLKPKKSEQHPVNSKSVVANKTEKEQLDMDRILDQEINENDNDNLKEGDNSDKL